MLLSKLIDILQPKIPYEFINEIEINYFSLPNNTLSSPNCIFIESEDNINSFSNFTKMIITNTHILKFISKSFTGGFLIVDNPRLVFFLLHNIASKFDEYKVPYFNNIIDPSAMIAKSAVLDVSNIIIGKDVIIEDFVVINKNVTIKDNCIIRSGTILGGTGFEFKTLNKELFLIQHEGSVIIEEDVEIQHHCVVDKAIYPYDATIIGNNSKLDNFIHIAHAVKIGNSVMIAAGAIIAGRTIIGDNCWIGPGTVISNGLTIGNNSRVNIGSVLINSISSDNSYSGNFAIEHKTFMKNMLKLKKGIK